MKNRVLITGATGFIASNLAHSLKENGYDISFVSRSPKRVEYFNNEINIYSWEEKSLQEALENSDFVIHLAGKSLAESLWTKKNKAVFRSSRINTGRKLSQIIKDHQINLKGFIQASAIGFYGDRGEEVLDEGSGKGRGFLADLVEEWENSTQTIEKICPRLVLRTGIVLSEKGGLLKKIRIPFKLFLGGHFGKGKNWQSCIALQEFQDLILNWLKNPKTELRNAVDSKPKRSKVLFQELGKRMKRPSYLHIPSFFVKLLPGNMGTEFFLASQRVISKK